MIANVEKYTTSVADMKALGFCVSKEHAKFMADFFNRHAIPALELDSDSSKEDRATAKKRLDSYRMDPRAIYKKDSFARLCVYAGVKEDFEEPDEKDITKALARLASIDSRCLLQFIIRVLPVLDRLDFEALNMLERRMLQMFYVTVWMDVIDFEHPEAAYRQQPDEHHLASRGGDPGEVHQKDE